MAYSTVLTYLLWLTLGWFGVHHFYLRRDQHAFVWLWTLGGGCGIGWLVEFFRLPEYVRTANMEALYASGQWPLPAVGVDGEPPPFRVKRFIGEFVFSMWLGGLSMLSIPKEITAIYPWLTAIVTPAGVAIGAHTVANIGLEECDLIVCLAAAFVMFPVFLMSPANAFPNTLTMTALLTSLAVNYNWGRLGHDDDDDINAEHYRWWTRLRKRLLLYLRQALAPCAKRHRRTPRERLPVCVRIVIFLGCSLEVLLLLFSVIFLNTYITTDYGEKVQVAAIVEHFILSPSFRETGWRVLRQTWESGSAEDFFRELHTELDPEGEQNALRVFNLTRSATEKEINDRYKELAWKFHPDRFIHVDDEEKKKVYERFIEMQQSYERISKIKARRMRKMRRNKINDEL